MSDSEHTESPALVRREDAPELAPAERRSIPGVTVPDCTFCHQPYSTSRPAVLVPGTRSVYGHGQCIRSSTIGMPAVLTPPRTLEEVITSAQSHLDAYLDADLSQPRLISDLHAAADELADARRMLRESHELVLGA